MRTVRGCLCRLCIWRSGTLESVKDCGSAFTLENKHELMP